MKVRWLRWPWIVLVAATHVGSPALATPVRWYETRSVVFDADSLTNWSKGSYWSRPAQH